MILVTGGLGYIGSHVVIYLLQNKFELVVVDNLSNSKKNIVDKIKEIADKGFKLYTIDLLDKEALDKVFYKHHINAVIHCAGLKAVNESINNPLEYYDVNLKSTLNLLGVMKKYNCRSIVFSSSAAVYGIPDKYPITEEASTNPINPYGRTKLYIENILKDIATQPFEILKDGDKEKVYGWRIILLRYFNPIGCHTSCKIGEDPNGIPNNLVPYILRVITDQKQSLSLKIFGNDYDTPDGTCIRDYIDINDLADAHVKALDHLFTRESICETYNVGTGVGTSVKEMVDKFEENGVNVRKEYVGRREGDPPGLYCSNEKIKEIGWSPSYSVNDSIKNLLKFGGLVG